MQALAVIVTVGVGRGGYIDRVQEGRDRNPDAPTRLIKQLSQGTIQGSIDALLELVTNSQDSNTRLGKNGDIEILFRVLKKKEKRKMGSTVLARVSSQQDKELVFRALAHNGIRMESLHLFTIEDVYTAI